jgi:hypothetical protein
MDEILDEIERQRHVTVAICNPCQESEIMDLIHVSRILPDDFPSGPPGIPNG